MLEPSIAAQTLIKNRKVLESLKGGTSSLFIIQNGHQKFIVKDVNENLHFANWLNAEYEFLCHSLSHTIISCPTAIDFLRLKNSAALVMNYIEGKSATDYLISADKRSKIILWEQIGYVLKALHTSQHSLASKTYDIWIKELLIQARQNLERGNVDGGTKEILERLENTIPTPLPTCLIHGDCTTDNLLFRENDFVAFIDLPFAGVGDKRKDLAYLLGGTQAPSNEERTVFEKAYGLGSPSSEEIRYFQDLYLFF